MSQDLFDRLVTFMRESDEWGTPADVLRSAEEAGLSIVTEAERRVLEGWRIAPVSELEWLARNIVNMRWLRDAVLAELARRGVSSG